MEDDPAAAFLAREQDDLAGIADDTLGFTSSDVTAPPLLVDPPPQDSTSSDFLGTEFSEPAAGVSISPDPYAAVSQMDSVPECIQKWKEEQAVMLANKDKEEEEALEELRTQAKVEIQEWYNRHEDQMAQTKTTNRQAEAVFIDERDEDIPGHEWERVARLCDFNPKNSKNTKDVSRMRSIFLQLKQTPLVRD